MQTFLPYANFKKSAQCLDNKRLGKQRVEVLQILKTLAGESKGWQNHPAVKMWRGYEAALIDYGKAICEEWKRRCFKDTCYEKIIFYSDKFAFRSREPWWFNYKVFHNSHKSNLLRKDPVHYGQFNWNVPDDLPYVWPESKQYLQYLL